MCLNRSDKNTIQIRLHFGICCLSMPKMPFLQELPQASQMTQVCTEAGIVRFCWHTKEKSDPAVNPKHSCPGCLHNRSTQRLTAEFPLLRGRLDAPSDHFSQWILKIKNFLGNYLQENFLLLLPSSHCQNKTRPKKKKTNTESPVYMKLLKLMHTLGSTQISSPLLQRYQ